MEANAPTALSRENSRVLRWFFGVLAAVTLAVLFFFDPVRYGFYPRCVFHELTGWNCPGCGATRAAYALLHGHLITALHDNALFVVSLPLLAFYFGKKYVWNRGTPPALPSTWSRLSPWLALGVVILFGILRNLPYPAFRWMSP